MNIEYAKSASKAINALDSKTKLRIWDPDFTKLTPDERKRLELAEIEISNGETVSHEDIDWE